MKELNYEDCIKFHGHSCPGLLIGYKAAIYAKEILDMKRSFDEEYVVISENDACGVDSIQVILGTTAGKGNLIFRLTGKIAYNFFDRNSEKSLRLVLKPDYGITKEMNKEERLNYISSLDPKDMFLVKDTIFDNPKEAEIYQNVICELCNEKTAEPYIRLQNGRKICSTCLEKNK